MKKRITTKDIDEFYRTKKLSNWPDACKFLKENLKEHIFRGHPRESSPLRPTLERLWELAGSQLKPKGIKTKRDFELLLIREFMRGSIAYIDFNDIPQAKDYLSWFSLMRHHGAPTRLLDFTYSFYVAAYFALEETKEKEKQRGTNELKEEPAAVWAINLTWLKKKIPKINDEEVNFHNPEEFSEFFSIPKSSQTLANREPPPCVAPVKPLRLNRRLTLQQGLFLCQRNMEMTFEKNLRSQDTEEEVKKSVFKLILSPNMRKAAINDLHRMNVNRVSLFQDLDGFAMSLKDQFYLNYKYQIKDLENTVSSGLFSQGGIKSCCK